MSDALSGGPVIGEDGLARCPWAATHPLNRVYHDTEWGVPVHGERALFERISLEAFQAGLSWLTILSKRPAFRELFAGFDPDAVARFGDDDVERLMTDARIVRNRAKIEAARANARAVVALREDGGLDRLIWSHRPRLRRRRAPWPTCDEHPRVEGAVGGPEVTRVRLRRADHRPRPDGGDRARRRPPRRLPPARRVRSPGPQMPRRGMYEAG